MKQILLFTWEQLLRLVGLLKPIIEMIKQVFDIFKKEDEDHESK